MSLGASPSKTRSRDSFASSCFESFLPDLSKQIALLLWTVEGPCFARHHFGPSMHTAPKADRIFQSGVYDSGTVFALIHTVHLQ
jgi:hypothetical protein